MRPRFQADADFNQKIVLGLRRREPVVDFQDAPAGGVIGAPDSDVLHKAADLGRILISHDRKTMPAHFARFLDSRPSPGLIIVPQDLDIGLAIEDLLMRPADLSVHFRKPTPFRTIPSSRTSGGAVKVRSTSISTSTSGVAGSTGGDSSV